MWAGFCQNGSYVYIGNTTSNDSLIELKNMEDRGQILSVRWRPNSTELFISGCNMPNATIVTKFLLSYDVVTQ